MKNKILLVLFIFMIGVNVVSASDIVIGINGISFDGNTTLENQRILNSTGAIVLEQIVHNNLNGWWTFDKTSGNTIEDESGVNILTAEDSGNISWETGRYGNAVVFSQSGLSNKFSGTDYDPTTDMTLSYWYQLNASSFTDQYMFENGRWSQTVETERQVTYIRNSSAVAFGITDNYAKVNDTWYFCMFTRNYTTGETNVYRDNGLINSNTDALGALGDVNVFNIMSGTKDLDIKVDDVRYYNRVLNESERGDVWNNTHFSDGNITTIIQNATNGNIWSKVGFNGTIQNGTSLDIYGNSSTDGITGWTGWILIKDNAISDVSYNVQNELKKQYYKAKYISNTTTLSNTTNVENIIMQTETSGTYDIFIINETQTLVWFETSNYTGIVSPFNFIWENRIETTGNTSTLYYQNGTSITSNSTYVDGNVTLIPGFLIPEGTYYIEETVDSSTMTIPMNSWGMFNNWTSTMTFAGIAANESNDVCYTYYNVTSGLWESYYVGYSWNADYQLSKDASVMGYFDSQTDITSSMITPSSTELYTGWDMLGVQSSSNQTISGIIVDIGANCSDSWYFNSSTGSYSNTTTHSIQPNQGFLAYITQNMTWTRSAM